MPFIARCLPVSRPPRARVPTSASASRQGRGATPKTARSAPQSSTELAGRARRASEIGGRDRHHSGAAAARRQAQRHDRLGKAMPRGRAGAGEMEGAAAGAAPASRAARWSRMRVGQIRAPRSGEPCWSATTLSSSRFAASCSMVLHEIAAVRAVDPGRAQDHMARARLAHRPLAGLLAGAVDIERRHRVVLDVGAALGAVEHVVGRDVDQRQPARGAGRGQRGAAPSALTAKAALAARSPPDRRRCRPRR